MTSFHRKLYDKTHGKAHRGQSRALRDKDGHLILRYGRHTTLAMFSLRDAERELQDETQHTTKMLED